MTEFIGAKISLISRSDIRYVGILHEINSEESTVALEQVRSFGTEGRRGGDEVPASDNVFEYIVFRGSDVKDLKVEEPAKKVERPPRGVPDDPAILTATAPPPRAQQSPVYPPMHQYPPPPPPGYGPQYGNYQYGPPHFGGPAGFRPPPQHMSPPEGFSYPPKYPPGMPPPQQPQQQQQQSPQKPQSSAPQAPEPTQPAPSQPIAASPPSPVKETKPDVTTATASAPVPIKPVPTQPSSKPATVVPAMPIPISIPAQPRVAKPVAQAAKVSPTAVQPAVPVSETAKVAAAADVQNLAKNLSETKLSSSGSSGPGAGVYLTNPPAAARRRQFGAAARPMDRDYDFESGNAKFNKEDVAKEVAAQTGGGEGVEGTSVVGPTAAQLSAALASHDTAYDKGKSFFDNISCENKDRSQNPEGGVGGFRRQEERKLNMETFGQASVDSGRYGRGGYHRGGRGGWRGGRGGYGYRGRGGAAANNPWRGGAPRANGQTHTSSETAT